MSYFWFDTQPGMVHCTYYILRGQVFVLANSVDRDEMPHYAAFHHGLHCLPKYALRATSKERDK